MKPYKYKEYLSNVLPCIGVGLLCGAITGAVVFLFKVAAGRIEHLSRWLYTSAKHSWLYIVAVFAVLIVAALVMALIHKWAPESKGGGIPRSEGVLRGRLAFRWFPTLVGTVVGSFISFFCALPLGSEGPAVLIGTALGGMCGCIAGNRSAWGRYVMTGGAGAGFAIATGAPFAGILFALEEIHKRFTPMLVLTVSASVMSATYCNGLLCAAFGVDGRLFAVGDMPDFALADIGFLLLLAIVVSAAVALFDFATDAFSRVTKYFSKLLSAPVKLVIMFVITGIVALVFTDAVYSGHDLLHEAAEGHQALLYLAALLVVRMLLMVLVTDSGATGGIFISTLAIGSLFGAITGQLLVAIGMPAELYTPVVLLGMCAFIGGTLRAPLTATVLFVELTGQFTNLFYVIVVVFVVNIITELLNQTAFYDRALEDMEHAQNGGKQPVIAHFKMTVSPGAFVVGKAIRDVMWPSSSVVISITRAHEHHQDMDNDGEKKLYVGDTLVLRARYYDEEKIRGLLQGLVGTHHAITKIEQST